MERRSREPEEKHEDLTTAYTTAAVGVALAVAAVLVAITAGAPAAAFPFLVASFACLGWGISQIAQKRRALPQPVNKERELLSAIRDNGRITPAEAAMETSLTVREADAMLSELASGGHVMVERRNNALFYSLPGREDPALEGPDRT